MFKKEVIEFFGTQAETAKALGIERQAVHQWPEIIPIGRAYQVQVVTNQKLKVDEKLYKVVA